MSGGERREQIIDAALSLFAEHGLRCTTRQLAEAAGISEAALYLHFETKDALFEAIVRRKAAQASELEERLKGMLEEPPRRVFEEVGRTVLETHTADPTFLRLLLHSGLERHALFQTYFQVHVRESAAILTAYVERQQREGTFRPCDSRLAVRAFMGMLFHHLLMQEVFEVSLLGTFAPAEAATFFATCFLDGMCGSGTSGDGEEAACA
ncbi:MAG TPA: TetR/AcrR family transcriptional regulator [Gemmatimonadota bacterium]|jgi:AcrR family transcriptional regulator